MGWIRATTVGDLFGEAVPEAGAAEVVFPDRRVTYRELAAVADHYARGLAGLGVGQNDRVGILLPNGVDYVGCFLGAAYLGAVPVLVNARFKGNELAMVIPHADIRVLVTCRSYCGSPDYAQLVTEALPSLAGRDPAGPALPEAPALCHAVCLHGEHAGFLSREAFDRAAGRVAPARIEPLRGLVRVRDPGLVMYTSGTTASPKGCLISHEALTRQAVNYVERFGLSADDRFWDPLPLYHIGGLVPLLGCFAARCTYCHAGRFEAGAALRMLERERCTVGMPVFETIWQDVLNHPRFPETDLSSLRTVLNIGVPERLREMQARMPDIIQVSGSGATEYTGNLALGEVDDPLEARLTTAGRLMPGAQTRILDVGTGVECPPGAEGELLYRGCGLFDGYYKEPELTAQLVDEQGWFHSGDLARMDEEGRLVWVGRSATCSRSVARTSRRRRSRTYSRPIPRWTSCRWWACPTPDTARCPWRSSNDAAASRSPNGS